jgi:hypothetical protein
MQKPIVFYSRLLPHQSPLRIEGYVEEQNPILLFAILFYWYEKDEAYENRIL